MSYTLKGIFLAMILCSCTYSITQVHTEGTASDVVDETQTNTPDVKPNLEITLPKVTP